MSVGMRARWRARTDVVALDRRDRRDSTCWTRGSPVRFPGLMRRSIQAGLAGYSDGAMRLIARRHGCPFCVTEALLDRTLVNGGKGRRKEDPDLIAAECGMGETRGQSARPGSRIIRSPARSWAPIPRRWRWAPRSSRAWATRSIDVNLACPVKKIKKRSRGGHFLAHPDDGDRDPPKAVREAAGDLVTTVKLRRAFDDTPEMAANFERIFDAAYELGYAWATVHCRTVEQRYVGPGRWEFLQGSGGSKSRSGDLRVG